MRPAIVVTHTSTLYFVGDRVYKRKRPLDLGFSDFRTCSARLRACTAELNLNRRLAPDVYLGIEDVLDLEGHPCDHLVVMRRMPDDARLARLVAAGSSVEGALDDVAHQLADLHRRSPAPDRLRHVGTADFLSQLWVDGLDALVGFEDLVPEETRERTRELALSWLAGHGPLLESRLATGRVHDGHGDLLADDIFVLPDGPRILDCLEFDERLRVCDGIADAAFLAMDLERLGAPDAARHFLDAYEKAADDVPPTSLEDFYLAYRTHIRSKVACIRARQTPTSDSVAAARQLADLAVAHLEQARARLVVVGGLPGTGKSTLASALAQSQGWAYLSSDVTRKGLPDQGQLYSEARTRETYESLVASARAELEAGRSVVLDASFTDARWRVLARWLGAETHTEVTELRCTASAEVARDRIRARTDSMSDATPEVHDAMQRAGDPWPEAAAISTEDSPAQTLQRVRSLLALGRPDGLMPARA